MLGTIVNTCTIILGSVIGAQVHRGVKEKYKEAVFTSLGLACLGIGLGATIRNMPNSEFPVLFILAMAIGSVVGTWLKIDDRFHSLVDKLGRRGSGAENGRSSLAEGLSTACLLYCVGPLSMLGPVTSALQGDNTLLFTNATLDFVSSFVFASTYGIGMILAAPVLFCWQGMFYLIAKLSSSAISDALMCELLIVGGLIITASGLSLLKIRQGKTLDMLPALLVPVLWFVGKWLVGLF
ncbi:MAG: DUF554 domain-containing protein [Bacteroidales bacterium]|nr:DUF554 domain-containing protein [Bacteroidales bacterium]